MQVAKATHCSMLFNEAPGAVKRYEGAPDLDSYVEFIVFFSGGKDSIAAVLLLLEMGVDPSKIEIHHHLVDGAEGSTLMDWPCTEDYCRKFAAAFGLRFVTTWRVGGFEAEMLRENQPTAPVMIPDVNGGYIAIGGKGPLNTRRKFPQVTANQLQRWCSSATKADCGDRYLNNHPRFQDGQRRLIITGERAEESPARSKYAEFFVADVDNRKGIKTQRYLDHWRAVLRWKEADVWAIMERFRVNPHLAYKIGMSRCSCSFCIFQTNDGWATMKFIAPKKFDTIGDYERDFGLTIDRTRSVDERAALGSLLPGVEQYGALSQLKEYPEPILVSDWKLPAGAFKSNGGRF